MRNHNSYLPAIFLMALVVGACGGGKQEATEAPKEEAPVAAATPPTPIDPSQVATITGKVTYEGAAPKAKRIFMDADQVCSKQHSSPVFVEEVKVGAGGGLQNVFVWVKDGLGNRSFEVPKEPAMLDQRGCIYEPHVFGVQTGQEIKILNSDPTTHNIHPLPQQNREWNQSQPPSAAPLVKSFPRQEVPVPVKCNIHPWMKSYVGVVSHPFFAVTSGDGIFTIKGLPPGEYTIEAWHEKLGTTEQKVTVGPSESKAVDFSFKG